MVLNKAHVEPEAGKESTKHGPVVSGGNGIIW